ncbi:hypothetical protein N0V93_009545 [Gnomoniopsis smithogilvyi]|uniref:HhH-GPD domain-containing protein n=1 Tax=Gnomoniopsis smithogilvyi TaxID=1191159 RepID=A0A9W8YNC5_9PEZI|nr:hypothetical protein N0V93_009545 [Gnomoniopsis smithogilvyi]
MQRRQHTKVAPKYRTPYQKYTLTDWGETPWPDFNTPSAVECEEVYSRLMVAHGERLRPAHITAPSLEVAGCGEVPQVLDAIIRTMISANTKFEYADAALKSLISKVGVILDNKGLGTIDHPELQHCLDYDYIRTTMKEEELAEAIATAGNQKQTASRIMTILADVFTKNKERVEAFRKETPDNPINLDDILAGNLLSEQEKQWEINMFEHSILNLEFLKKLSPEHAMNEMLGWKGIGVKTAACVLMFCMQQDILACDTHCIRLSKWLGWVPLGAKDELVFAHIDARVPNHLKYALHQLFIQHGKDCFLCRDSRNEEKEELEKVVCPLEDLLDRGALKAYKADLKAKTEAKKGGKVQDDAIAQGKAQVEPLVDEIARNWAKESTDSKTRAGVENKAKSTAPVEKAIKHDPVKQEEAIVDNTTQATKKHARGSANAHEAHHVRPKRLRTTMRKKQPAVPPTTRQTRSQTKAKQRRSNKGSNI